MCFVKLLSANGSGDEKLDALLCRYLERVIGLDIL